MEKERSNFGPPDPVHTISSTWDDSQDASIRFEMGSSKSPPPSSAAAWTQLILDLPARRFLWCHSEGEHRGLALSITSGRTSQTFSLIHPP